MVNINVLFDDRIGFEYLDYEAENPRYELYFANTIIFTCPVPVGADPEDQISHGQQLAAEKLKEIFK